MRIFALEDMLAHAGRLDALCKADLLDTESEPEYDRITSMICRLMGVPISMISVIDLHHQYIKSHTGLPQAMAEARRLSMNQSVCKYVIERQGVVAIDDASNSALIHALLPIPDLYVGAYLGAPLFSDGFVIGSLCAIDVKPRQWSADEMTVIQDMAHFASNEIALRERMRRQ